MSTSIKKLLIGSLLSLSVSLFAACGDMNGAEYTADLDEAEESVPAADKAPSRKMQAPPTKAPRRPIERLQPDEPQPNVLPEPPKSQ